MQNTLFRSSSFRLCYNSCRRHYPKRKPFWTAVTLKILAGETYVGEKKAPSLGSLHFGSIFFWWGRKPENPRKTLDSGSHWLKLNLQMIEGMRGVTDSHCACMVRAIFVKKKSKQKNEVWSVFTWRHGGHGGVNKKTPTILEEWNILLGIKLYFYANPSFCFIMQIWLLVTWANTLYTLYNLYTFTLYML